MASPSSPPLEIMLPRSQHTPLRSQRGPRDLPEGCSSSAQRQEHRDNFNTLVVMNVCAQNKVRLHHGRAHRPRRPSAVRSAASPEGCKPEPVHAGARRQARGGCRRNPLWGLGCAGGVGAPVSLLAVLQGSAPRAARQGSEPGRRRAYHMSTEHVIVLCENSRRPHLDRDGLKSKPWSVRRHCEPWQLGCAACHWFTRR